jgi:citrate lyase beta subunit
MRSLYFATLLQHFPIEPKKFTNTLVRVSGLQTEIEKQDISCIIPESLAHAIMFSKVFLGNIFAADTPLIMVGNNNVKRSAL